jgi:hypothetical protein
MHISSLAHKTFALLNGDTSSNPSVFACLRVGDYGAAPHLLPQFSITDSAQRAAHGRLTWDADHRHHGGSSPFFSVAPVRLDMKADGECLLSVGTGDYVRLVTEPFRWIERVQVAAVAATCAPERALQWDALEVVFCYADGRNETCSSSCLPRAITGSRGRRAAQSPAQIKATPPRQFADIATGSREVVGVRIRGQVTLRANDSPVAASPLAGEDLQGRILVFTDASTGRG